MLPGRLSLFRKHEIFRFGSLFIQSPIPLSLSSIHVSRTSLRLT